MDRDLTVEERPRLLEMKLTRRMLLSLVVSQYDPMGLVRPLLVILKIQLRDLYWPERDLWWDKPIPSDLHIEWVETITMFLQIVEIELNRSFRS